MLDFISWGCIGINGKEMETTTLECGIDWGYSVGYGNILYRVYLGIVFPYSLLTQ